MCLKNTYLEKLKGKRRSELLLGTLRVTGKEQELQMEFWCQSGMQYFKPTEEPFKNCVEVAIFGFTRLALRDVGSRGKIEKADINYMTDLSPCPVCVKRFPTQQSTLEADFPNITFSYNDSYVMKNEDYQEKGIKGWIELLTKYKKKLPVVESISAGSEGPDPAS